MGVLILVYSLIADMDQCQVFNQSFDNYDYKSFDFYDYKYSD